MKSDGEKKLMRDMRSTSMRVKENMEETVGQSIWEDRSMEDHSEQ